MFSERYRTHRGVTGPMSFKKSGDFFFRKLVLQGYWCAGCHLNTFIDLANNAPASKRSVKTICFFSGGYRTHRGVTGPMNFKKSGDFLFSETRAPGILVRWLPFKHFY